LTDDWSKDYQRVVSYRDKDGFEVPKDQAVEVFIDYFLDGEFLAIRKMVPYMKGIDYETPAEAEEGE
jgi:hypothetical protein